MQFINKKQYGKKQAGEWLAFFVSAKLALLIIKGRIECIEVLTVQVYPAQSVRLSPKRWIMYNFTLHAGI